MSGLSRTAQLPQRHRATSGAGAHDSPDGLA
jgi:hypothetical protein